jgi:hypothetical protein
MIVEVLMVALLWQKLSAGPIPETVRKAVFAADERNIAAQCDDGEPRRTASPPCQDREKRGSI